MTTPGIEPGLSRPRRDVLTTRRCGLADSRATAWRQMCGVPNDLLARASSQKRCERVLGDDPFCGCCVCSRCDAVGNRSRHAFCAAKNLMGLRLENQSEIRHLWDSNPRGETPSA